MKKDLVPLRALIRRLLARSFALAVCVAAAVLAIGLALAALTVLMLALGALGAGEANPLPHGVVSAGQDAATAFYLAQAVGVSFFNHTAELRFVAVPVLLLIGLSIVAATALAAKFTLGPVRRKLAVAVAVALPYALLVGLAGALVPLDLTARGLGNGIPASPQPLEAFILPLGWALLFAFVGGLIGACGRSWRKEGSRLLGAWAAPMVSLLRVLMAAITACAVIALVSFADVMGVSFGGIAGAGIGRTMTALGGAVLALPTLAAAVLVSGFGVSFGWQVDALSQGHGTMSAFGGALPSANSGLSHSHAVPVVLGLAPVVVLLAVGAIGWMSARRWEANPRRSLASALRAAVLTTMAIWLLGLLTTVDAQAGGLLGGNLAPNGAALLWRVPLVSLLGCIAGSLAFIITRGGLSRRELTRELLSVGRISRWTNPLDQGRWASRGVAWRAAAGASFAAVPLLIVALGPTGAASSAPPPKPSMGPIAHAAEQRLERDGAPGTPVAVTVNPATRVIDTASVHTPTRALGIARSEPQAAKAKEVLKHYGSLFGLSEPTAELGAAETIVDGHGKSHVYFTQMADGRPVFGGRIGVHFSREGEEVTFLGGSLIPEVSVEHEQATLSRAEAVMVAKTALPGARLVQPADLAVYAGVPPYISGPNARLAWFVWLINENRHASTEYVVDAVTGKVLDTLSKTTYALYREVYDAEEHPELRRKLARIEGEKETGDTDTDNAYSYTGVVHEFFEGIELDHDVNQGGAVISTVHYAEQPGKEFENAFWNGQQMVFGNHYASALDVVGHEMTHAVTEATSGLIDSGQSGALNESFSDMMGATVEIEYDEREEIEKTEEELWEVGEKLPGGAIRSLAEPAKFHELAGAGDNSADPEQLSEWDPTCLDNFGVHIDSTITSHAYYLVAQSLGLEYAKAIFASAWTEYLTEGSTLEDARAAVLAASEAYFSKGSKEYEALETSFDEVGLNGSAEPPAYECEAQFECSFARALKDSASASSSSSAMEMLGTLYKARGELAQPSAAGRHFMPLYEQHMGRITELVAYDPPLAEMATVGLEEITPALEALMEGEGAEFELSRAEMARIESALKRLAQDDRLYQGEGSGELAELIEEELEWLALRSYGGMSYASGWNRLNTEVEAQTALLESGELIDPNCNGSPYSNNFQINGFFVNTEGDRIPGQVSPIEAGGVICGAAVEAAGEPSECRGEATLNTNVTVELPPGDEVNSTEEMEDGSWVGEAIGRAIACAGEESRVVYGQAGLQSMESWSSAQCPAAAIACYKGSSTYESHTGHSYAWVLEEEGRLTLTTSPVQVVVEGIEVPVSLGQFEVKLCAHAGEPSTTKCGGESAPWLHRNGEAAEAGCPTERGRYVAQAENAGGEKTLAASACVHLEPEAHMQALNAGHSINAVSCVPGTTDCVASDSQGGAFYATDVSATSAATWNSWSGPSSESPSEAVECPSSSLCLLADGEVTGGGGKLYHATSLGGSFSTSFSPSNGVNDVSCPSTAFCVASEEGGGYIRYSTKPSGISWTARSIGSGAMKGVSCLSASFCAVIDDSGHVHVATTESHVKEAAGWTSTDVDGTTELLGIACSSTSACIAVDGSGKVLNLTIGSEGEATASTQSLSGAGELDAVTCAESTCVAVDRQGGTFTSTDGGSSWVSRLDAGAKVKSVSCASEWLCAAVTGSGEIATFNPSTAPPSKTQTIDSGNSINAASCISGTTDCVVSDSEGNAFYATDVSTESGATWNSWSGPSGESPSQAVICPSTSLCLLAAGKGAAGGNLYYATSLGGAFTNAYSPTYGVDAIACVSASFCVDGQDAYGYFRYSTEPGSTSWHLEQQGASEANAMKGVSCLSSSFCVIADGTGHVHVATSTEQVESSSWTETDVDGSTALNAIACTSTTSCVAVDGSGNVLLLAIASGGEATASKLDIDHSNDLSAVTCTTDSTCVAVDHQGGVFVSSDAGESWGQHLVLGGELASVSCAKDALCVTAGSEGKVTTFDAR